MVKNMKIKARMNSGALMIVSIAVFLLSCSQPSISSIDQTSFAIGSDLIKYTDDPSFTQAVSGSLGTGTTTYSSSDESVAMVDSTTGEVVILTAGETIISAFNPGDSDYNPAGDSYQLTVIDHHFITTWKTMTAGESITIPINTIGDYSYDYSVDWGDGNRESGFTDSATHTYSSAGTYTVKISGTFPAVHFYYSTDYDKILSIDNWGNIAWQTMSHAFCFCSNLTYNASDAPDLSNVTDLAGMFKEATLFDGDLNNWDVSSVTNMGMMFFLASSFNGDVSSWDVGNVTDMKAMFQKATSFNQNLNSWDVSSVTLMDSMFSYTSSFNGDISSWNVGSVTGMSFMFSYAESFNGDISGWDVSSVQSMRCMFKEAVLFNQDISSWNVAAVTNMSEMFYGTTSFNQNLDDCNWSSTMGSPTTTDMFTLSGLAGSEPSWYVP